MAHAHLVQSGDCLSSLGLLHGFAPATLWQHPGNAILRQQRSDPNVLLPDVDVVFIPDPRRKEVVGMTGQRHKFMRRGVPELLRIRLLRADKQPRKQTPYKLTVNGLPSIGLTDDDGVLTAWIPPNAMRGELVIDPEGRAEKHILNLGHLDPVECSHGVEQRLCNLGYLSSKLDHSEEALRRALGRFQEDAGLRPTGMADDTTRRVLLSRHGC